MYKLLLCSRYLFTRYIALASIISVMLGVATMIVVNSVMSGFQTEMYKRLHGILSDVVVEARAWKGSSPQILEQEIRSVLGNNVQGLTNTVHVPALLSYQWRGQWMQKQINLIGIDRETYAARSATLVNTCCIRRTGSSWSFACATAAMTTDFRKRVGDTDVCTQLRKYVLPAADGHAGEGRRTGSRRI